MNILKKTWWFFSLIGVAAAFLNPYIGPFALFGALMFFINAIFVGIGRTNNRYRNKPGFETITRVQSKTFWAMVVCECFFAFIFAAVVIGLPILAMKVGRDMEIVAIAALPRKSLSMLTVSVALIFEGLSLFLAAARGFDLYINKNYRLREKQGAQGGRMPLGFFSHFRVLGKVWFVFVALAFASGAMSFEIWPVALLLLFECLPVIIVGAIIRSCRKTCSAWSGNANRHLQDTAKRARELLILLKNAKWIRIGLCLVIVAIPVLLVCIDIWVFSIAKPIWFVCSIICYAVMVLSVGGKTVNLLDSIEDFE
jgi:hypothetical protein